MIMFSMPYPRSARWCGRWEAAWRSKTESRNGGVIIRHLILPGKIENSIEVLEAIKRYISTSVSLSIMSQYTPIRAVADHPLLGRRITKGEYETVVNKALDMGFDNIFIQDVNNYHLTPDFDRENPFSGE